MSVPVAGPDDPLLFTLNYRTRNLIIRRVKHPDRPGPTWTVETCWKPREIDALKKELPPCRIAFPCRHLCGKNLRRPHLTCILSLLGLGCRIRRTYYHKLPDLVELDYFTPLQIMTLKSRRFRRVKDWILFHVLRWTVSLLENTCAN